MSGTLRAISAHIQELRAQEDSDSCWFVLPDPDDESVDWFKFVVEIEGPAMYGVVPSGGGETRPSPYVDGLFRLLVTIGPVYPAVPPEIQFITKVWHPNVEYDSGKPCKDIIDTPWRTPSMQTLNYALLAIRQMLASPSGEESAVNSAAAAELLASVDTFDKHASADTARFARS